MTARKQWRAFGALLAVLALATATVGTGLGGSQTNAQAPIVIGWAFDSKGNMAPFDGPALAAAKVRVAQLNAKGNGVGAIMNMQTQFHLSEAGAGTSMRWEADVKIAGPVGAMGQRVLQPIINQQVGNVLTALEKQVEQASPHDTQT